MASVIWMGVFFLLVLELIITSILVLPLPRFLRNFIANKIFTYNLAIRFRFISRFIILALVLSVADAISTLRHLLAKEETTHHEPGNERAGYITASLDKQRKFRAERNMYLSSFALTLVFVIARIIDLMQRTSQLEEERDGLNARVKELSQENGNLAPVTDISGGGDTSPSLRRRPSASAPSNSDKTD